MKVGRNELCFIDLKLNLNDNKTQTAVYRKQTDSHLYLQTNLFHNLPSFLRIQINFCHNLPSFLGIKKLFALRLYRICSTNEKGNNKTKGYKAYLKLVEDINFRMLKDLSMTF